MSGEARILIVDDVPANLRALQSILSTTDAEVIGAGSGREAVSRLLREEFALVLLDVMMPEMNGFEVAELIRSNEPTQHTPIIFLTGMGADERMRFAGYEKGAVDYLIKPIDPTILRSKVDVFLRLFRQNQALALLAELERTQQELSRTHRDLERFVDGIFHDLQEPARAVAVALGVCREHLHDKLDAEAAAWLDTATSRIERLQAMVRGLREYADAGSSDAARIAIDLGDTLRAVLEEQRAEIRAAGARIEIEELPTVVGAPSQVHLLFSHLLDNALKFRDPARPLRVVVRAELDGPRARIEVRDNGLGFADLADPQRLFEAFSHFRARDQYEGSHLGLAVCRRIAEAHGGSIRALADPGPGATFQVVLPRDEDERGGGSND